MTINNRSNIAEKILQVNLHHAKATTANLCIKFSQEEFYAALLQEPYCLKGVVKDINCGELLYDKNADSNPRAAILFRKTAKFVGLNQFCTKDLVAATVDLMVDVMPGKVVLCSSSSSRI